MLSFDITDRNVRVVKGVESNGKIKISSAATLNLEEGLIVNGHVRDVPNVATLINGVLKRNKMPDKEAIVSISSNLTIFKEMTVARVKGVDLQKTVKQQATGLGEVCEAVFLKDDEWQAFVECGAHDAFLSR